VLIRSLEYDDTPSDQLTLKNLVPARLLLLSKFKFEGVVQSVVFVAEFTPFEPRRGASSAAVPPDSLTCPRFFLSDDYETWVYRCYDVSRVVGVAHMVPDFAHRGGILLGSYGPVHLFHLNRVALEWSY
jgi:hypothetical protein